MKATRREFVTLAGTVTAVVGMGEAAAAAANAPWHQRLRRVKVDAVLVNVTGMIAFYPTEVPFHKRSRFLGNRDFFGECCRAAKKRGMRVIGRMSPDLQWDDALHAHPEWFMRDREGRAVPAFSRAPGLWQTCTFSPYFSEQTPAIMREVNARYDIDGLYTNGWPNFHVPRCYCDICRRIGEPDSLEYHKRYMDRAVELWRLYDRIAKEKSPDNLFFGNLGGGVRSGLDLKRLGAAAEWFNADNQGRTGASPAWGGRRRDGSSCSGMPVTTNTSPTSDRSQIWRSCSGSGHKPSISRRPKAIPESVSRGFITPCWRAASRSISCTKTTFLRKLLANTRA